MNKTSRTVNAKERAAQALELRKAGATYEQIAEKLGYRNRSGAYKAIRNEIANITKEAASEVRSLELERLDAMLLGLWPQARAGDTWSVDRVISIMERRSRYLGLDSNQNDETDEEARSLVRDLGKAMGVQGL